MRATRSSPPTRASYTLRPMAAQRSIGIVHDPRYQDHRGPAGHPERPERLAAIASVIEAHAEHLTPVAARVASDDEIMRVHTESHLARIRRAHAQAPVQLDPDTYFGERSLSVALLAAGASVDLVARVCRGELTTGIAAVRPPGHHAEADRAMGFCVLNNVAIAARAAQRLPGIERVMVLDWDVHHGNGTQHIFEADPSVLYVSTHQFPYYPGTGDFGEVGTGDGVGATLNIPLPAGSGDLEYLGVFDAIINPAARRYRPDLILVSCGFDAHADDPLAAMQLSPSAFHAMTSQVRALAEETCAGRLVLLLEGGYALSGLREGCDAVLQALLLSEPAYHSDGPLEASEAVSAVIKRVTQVHGKKISGLIAR